MNEHSIPFEMLIKKRDSYRSYPSYPTCEQETETNRLLLFLCAFLQGLKSVFSFVGGMLRELFHTALFIATVVVIAYALALILPFVLVICIMAFILLAVL